MTAKYRIWTKTSSSCSLCSDKLSHKHNSLSGASWYTPRGLAGTKNVLPKRPCRGAPSASSTSLQNVLGEPKVGTWSYSVLQRWMLESILEQNDRAEKSVFLGFK